MAHHARLFLLVSFGQRRSGQTLNESPGPASSSEGVRHDATLGAPEGRRSQRPPPGKLGLLVAEPHDVDSRHEQFHKADQQAQQNDHENDHLECRH
jgi:hypothetical protein